MDLSPSFSPSLSSVWRHLPSVPGVYIYKNAENKVIYVGKAKNLKNRVSSYFRPPVNLGPKTSLLVQEIRSLEYIEVVSEIEALLLESRLIKKFKPRFNIISKDDKSPYYIHITHEEYPRPVINHIALGSEAGPFLNGYTPKMILRNFRRIAPYCLASRPVRKPCFYFHLGLCYPCPGMAGRETVKPLYRKNIIRLKRLLHGNFNTVKLQLNKEMKLNSSLQYFEKAAIYRDYLRSLEMLISPVISPEEYLVNPNLISDQRLAALTDLTAALSPYINPGDLNRIEMIDIAHLSGTDAAASLVVAINGQLRTDLYRHFNIKFAPSDSDVDMMREILIRRLKRSDWPEPNLLVLDGGIPQLSILKNITPRFPVIALAKLHETIIIPVADDFKEINLDISRPGLQLLQKLRDEAHRFSRRLHLKHRSRNLTRS